MLGMKNRKKISKSEKYTIIAVLMCVALSAYYFYPKKIMVCAVLGQPTDSCESFRCQGFIIPGIPNDSCYGKTLKEKNSS